ncbi:ATP-binding cassette transporter [Clonorchis sinensis]|uniref:ATP-binding cassette transporter n=1 Tax=Clonorchis sinensis TaxID=79923 RepID=G7Y715_CLOSI|nr:ATP-binding cassette transporter [Clonorchis sinensis]
MYTSLIPFIDHLAESKFHVAHRYFSVVQSMKIAEHLIMGFNGTAGSFARGTAPPGALKHWKSYQTLAPIESRRNIPRGPEHNSMRGIIRNQVAVSVRIDREVWWTGKVKELEEAHEADNARRLFQLIHTTNTRNPSMCLLAYSLDIIKQTKFITQSPCGASSLTKRRATLTYMKYIRNGGDPMEDYEIVGSNSYILETGVTKKRRSPSISLKTIILFYSTRMQSIGPRKLERSMPIQYLRRSTIAQQYRSELAQQLSTCTGSASVDEAWQNVKEAMLAAFSAVCPTSSGSAEWSTQKQVPDALSSAKSDIVNTKIVVHNFGCPVRLDHFYRFMGLLGDIHILDEKLS